MASVSPSSEAFVKKSLLFSITAMVLTAALCSIFLPEPGGDMEDELGDLLDGYYSITGARATSEEIWALTGIYTPYGTDSAGGPSGAWGTTTDGWVYGSRITTYRPGQLDGLPASESFRVEYDEDKGLYYYVEAGSDLSVDTDAEDPERGTLYTAVMLDSGHKSDVFFTPGGRVVTDDGSYYEFSGWRYSFQPIRDYRASNDLSVDRTSTSLSVVWYDYYGDTGLSGQLMLSGSDSGVAYITARDIVQGFSQASFSSTFDMRFNGMTIHVHIRINPYAVMMAGYSVEECYENGFWSMMVTSPAVSDASGLTLEAFSMDRIFEIVKGLLTFHMEDYGISGAASLLCGILFSASLYTSLIAIGLTHKWVLVLTAIMGVIQTIASL